ncbi:TadE/TadG family type IV pilus assembly protein [Sinomonas gamaensis]|uniref:TadE/TadG family type IV pilus assembly protein n=1 Tax=Sinomonas gamaensis TaxID=2565624 RepID=UPI00110805D0|nr:TadE/TadG family type IV pilus assembly protein [Sinomonas gamaensis]
MRWLAIRRTRSDVERGAVAVIVAILMVALIGMGAMAVDIGRVAAEKAQLQNGADASALAIASYCSANTGTCQSNGPGLANQYATANSNDGSAVVPSVTFPNAGTVTVQTSTPASGLILTLAQAFSMTSTQVQASATASWGGPGSGPAALPLTFAPCQFDLTGKEQAILTQGTGTPTCVSDSPSGAVIPGGFSIVQSDPGTCSATVHPDDPSTSGIDPYLDTSTGANLNSCKNDVSSYLGKVVLFPVWDHTNLLPGGNTRYYIKGFAAFFLDGYIFPAVSPKSGGSTNLIVDTSGKAANGIQGHFIEYVADATKYGGGGYTGGGATLPPTLIK